MNENSENLSALYQEEERAYTSGDYERAAKIRLKIQKEIRKSIPNW